MDRKRNILKWLAKLKYTKEVINAKTDQEMEKALKKFKKEHGQYQLESLLTVFNLKNKWEDKIY